jgi:hypothetical protein
LRVRRGRHRQNRRDAEKHRENAMRAVDSLHATPL